MKRLVCAILLLVSFQAQSQRMVLSDQAVVSVITLGPDQDDLVQAFGHSAVRVEDPQLRIDYAFNYGVFSFDQPNFYLNFARGHNYYYLGIASYPEFKDVYIYYNRFVHEQVLNLTTEEKQRVFDFLLNNAQPENRNYLYDYFYNNCSTKIRDVLADVLKGKIHFDSTAIKTDYTIRELTDPYLNYLPWGDLGIDIGLGSPIDHRARPYEYMYLPVELEVGIDHAYLEMNGNKIPLVKETKIVFANTPQPPIKSLIHPWTAFGVLLAIAIALSVWDLKRKKISVWFDTIVFTVVGIVGLVLFLLWTATDHHACVRNLNLAWALPTHLFVAFFLLKKNKPVWLKNYFLVVAILCGLLLIGWPVLPQLLNRFLIPVIATLGIRSFVIARLLRQAV